jgi:hypothetical protein
MERMTESFPRILDLVAEEETRVLIFLKELWPRIVGADLARHTVPISLKDGVLVLEVPSGVWQAQLSEMLPAMAAATNRFWKRSLVKEIQLRENDRGPESPSTK